jgi:hypothetical protein
MVKLSLCLTNEALRFADGRLAIYTRVFLTLALLELSGQLHAPAAFPQHPLDNRLSGHHSRSGRHREGKLLHPTGTRTSTPRPSSP